MSNERPFGRPEPVVPLRHFLDGIVTEMTFQNVVMETFTAENVAAFVDQCPGDVLNGLRDFVEQLPAGHDEPGWQKLISVHSVCAPWASEEDIRRAERDRRQRFRDGVRLFRSAVGGTEAS